MWISNGLFVEESFSGIPKQDYLHVIALNELNSIKSFYKHEMLLRLLYCRPNYLVAEMCFYSVSYLSVRVRLIYFR